MVRHTLKILLQMLQDFSSLSDHFGTLCIKRLIWFLIPSLSKWIFNPMSSASVIPNFRISLYFIGYRIIWVACQQTFNYFIYRYVLFLTFSSFSILCRLFHTSEKSPLLLKCEGGNNFRFSEWESFTWTLSRNSPRQDRERAHMKRLEVNFVYILN